ncbi:hypothetical protein MMC32_005229 [Xylographa parallela]|nr:hypothetical protein [Xylographa parallela]
MPHSSIFTSLAHVFQISLKANVTRRMVGSGPLTTRLNSQWQQSSSFSSTARTLARGKNQPKIDQRISTYSINGSQKPTRPNIPKLAATKNPANIHHSDSSNPVLPATPHHPTAAPPVAVAIASPLDDPPRVAALPVQAPGGGESGARAPVLLHAERVRGAAGRVRGWGETVSAGDGQEGDLRGLESGEGTGGRGADRICESPDRYAAEGWLGS